ncbi:MAG: DUF423 domain-containing protein [Rhodothalassiaceae bacterium]
MLKRRIAAAFGFAAVMMLAALSHWLQLSPKHADWLDLGAWMMLVHAGILLVLARHGPGGAFWLLTAGITLFSGSLYALALIGTLGPAHWLTPIGGLVLLVGWAWLIVRPGPR